MLKRFLLPCFSTANVFLFIFYLNIFLAMEVKLVSGTREETEGSCFDYYEEGESFTCSGYTHLPTNLSSGFKIKSLDMSYNDNKLGRLPSGTLLSTNLPNLEVLDLENCTIHEIKPGAFKGGNKIRKLYLQDNQIRILDTNIFSDVPNLQKLMLSANRELEFSEENAEFPEELSNLLELYLDRCQLKSILPNLFKNLQNLQILSLIFNQLTSLDWISSFPHLNSLRSLYLHNNLISKPNLNALLNLKNLSVLLLYENPIGEFPAAFPEMPFLRVLWLNGCNLTTIKPSLLKNLRSLHQINFSSNQLTNFDWINISGETSLTNLTEIDLSHNQIKKVNFDILKDLVYLKKLDLSWNEIEWEINGDQLEFPNLPNLEELNLNSCNLNSIGPHLLKNLRNLKTLKLAWNKLTKLHWEIILPLKFLTKVYLNGNPWHCDCHLRSLLNFLNQKRNIFFYNDRQYEPSQCTSSSESNHPDFPASLWLISFKNDEPVLDQRNYLVCPPKVSQLEQAFLKASAGDENAVGSHMNRAGTDTVLLKCHFSGFPVPQVKWRINGDELKEIETEIEIKISTTMPERVFEAEEKVSEEKAGGEEEEKLVKEFSNNFIQTLTITKDTGVVRQEDAAITPDDYECFVFSVAGNASKILSMSSTSGTDKEKDHNTPKMINLLIAYLASLFL